jgi:hypothetical protein
MRGGAERDGVLCTCAIQAVLQADAAMLDVNRGLRQHGGCKTGGLAAFRTL